jgi:hypothetical protein
MYISTLLRQCLNSKQITIKKGGALRAKKWPTADVHDIYRKLSSLKKFK